MVKLITGKTGSGKTAFSVSEFVKTVKDNKGAFSDTFCYYVVPEQFCVDVEEKILKETGGLLGSEVISFNRLVYRIFGELYDDLGEPLTLSGKAMLVTDIAYKNNETLKFFKGIYERPTAVEKLLETLTELRKYNFTPGMLKNLSDMVEGDNNKAKISEIAFFLEKYNESFSHKVLDLQLCFEEIAKAVEDGKTSISNSCIFVDSFSGFTVNELLMLKAFAKSAKSLTISVSEDLTKKFVMATPNETCALLRRMFAENDIKYENVSADGHKETRYKSNNVLKTFVETYPYAFKGDKKPDAGDSVVLTVCDNFYDEVRNLAKKLKFYNDSGYSYRDMAVVVPEIDENAYIIEAILGASGIPYFLDKKTNISGHPAIRYVNSFLNIISNDMRAADVVTLLKTGLYMPNVFSKYDVDKLENCLLEFGVKDKRSFKRMIDFLKENGRKTELAESVYDTVEKYSALAKDARTINNVLEIIIFFADETGLSKSLKYMSKSETESFTLVWNAFTDIVKECSEIIGNNKINGYKKLFSFVQKIFAAGVSSLKLGLIPNFGDTVQIGNIARSRYLDKKIIFILGACEGKFPSDAKESGFIGDKEREILSGLGTKCGQTAYAKALLGEFNAFSAMALASDVLEISYSKNNDGEEMRPSGVVARIERIFEIKPNIFKAVACTPKEREENFNVDAKITKILLNIGENFDTSITTLDKFVNCPYSFLLEKVLRLKERKELTVTNADTGSFFHNLLERAIGANKDALKDDLDDEKWRKIIKDAYEEYCADEDNKAENYKFSSSSRNMFLVDRIIDFAAYEGKKISEYSQNSGFEPVFEELAFGKSDGTSTLDIDCDGFLTRISGKIDRIDMRENDDGEKELAVVDYKSGNKTINERQIKDGVLFQLLAYKSAIEAGCSKELSEKIGGVALISSLSYYLFGKTIVSDSAKKHVYVEVRDKNASETGFMEKSFTADLDELEKENIEIIKKTAENISNGRFADDSERTKDLCKYCIYADICTKKGKKD